MLSMQKHFGRLWNKGPGDNAKASALLTDYEDADRVFAKIIDMTKQWKDAWTSLASSQLQLVAEFEGLYDPIVGASEGSRRQTTPTPQLQLERTFRLKKEYKELKTELLGEIGLIEEHVIRPAAEARKFIAPVRKTIGKRENKRLAYEKLQDKAIKIQRKPCRTTKDEAALAKLEVELSKAAEEFGVADEHLRKTLPPIIMATFNLIPPLLSNIVLIQTRLLGLYYTALHGYCQEIGLPSPPPPMNEVISTWCSTYGTIRQKVESLSIVARGNSAHKTLKLGDDILCPTGTGSNRTSSSSSSAKLHVRQCRVSSISSLEAPPFMTGNNPVAQPSSARQPNYTHPTDFTTTVALGGVDIVHPGQRTSRLHTSDDDSAVSPSTPSRNVGNNTKQSVLMAAKKKAPPPPPPPKRISGAKKEEWVIAQYAFAAQGPEDLSFQEGDKIKVLWRSKTDQDWWVGELNGVKGNFPANYCKAL